MKNGLLIAGCAAAAGVVLAVGISAAQRPDSLTEAGTANDLHYLFDQRFQTIDGKTFGLRRIPITPEHSGIMEWKPERQEEKRFSTRLKAAGQTVLFMVANSHGAFPDQSTVRRLEAKHPGQTFLGAGGLETFDKPPTGQWQGVSAPLLLTGNKPSTPLPTYGQLTRGVKESIAALKAEDTYEFTAGKWSVHARPIRASKTACLSCHKDKGAGEVGDLLGVGLYAFTPEKTATAP